MMSAFCSASSTRCCEERGCSGAAPLHAVRSEAAGASDGVAGEGQMTRGGGDVPYAGGDEAIAVRL